MRRLRLSGVGRNRCCPTKPISCVGHESVPSIAPLKTGASDEQICVSRIFLRLLLFVYATRGNGCATENLLRLVTNRDRTLRTLFAAVNSRCTSA